MILMKFYPKRKERIFVDYWISPKKSRNETELLLLVVTISPSFNLYKIVVFPAASKPTIKIRYFLHYQNKKKKLW